MRYPKFLQSGGKIGFVAPSFGCATEPYKSAFEHAQETFHKLGYGIQIGPNCYAGDGIGISNTPDLCAKELNEMYVSDENDVLISCGGGELMCEILPKVAFDNIKRVEPKWFMGYSDNTNFTFLETILTDTASVYAPCAGAFGMEPWDIAIKDAFGILTGDTRIYDAAAKEFTIQSYPMWEKESFKSPENPLAAYHLTEPVELRVYQNGAFVSAPDSTFSGRLLGGCLDCLTNLCGTSFDKVSAFLEKYREDGIVWFLESCDLNVFSIRRALWNLEQAGWFRYTKGFMIGRPYVFGQELMGLNQYDAVTAILAKYDVPIVFDVNIGHLPPAMPIICGSVGTVTVSGQNMNIKMKLV